MAQAKMLLEVIERSSFVRRPALDANVAGPADRSLRRAVLARLIAHPFVSTGHIRVAAMAGGVTLSGSVSSDAQKDAAVAATRRVEGVQKVADELSVALPCPDVAEPPAEDLEGRSRTAATRTFRAFHTLSLTEIGIVHPDLRL